MPETPEVETAPGAEEADVPADLSVNGGDPLPDPPAEAEKDPDGEEG